MYDETKDILALIKSLEQKLIEQQDQIRQLKNRVTRQEGSNKSTPEIPTSEQKPELQKTVMQPARAPIVREEKPAPKITHKASEVGETEMWVGKYGLQILGVIVFLLGAGFGLKYSIEKGWISPLIRFLSVIAAGFASIGMAELLHKKLNKWTDACLGGGIALLYAAIYYGHAYYGLFSANVALISTALTGAMGMFFAVRYKSQVIATLSALGSFLLPQFGHFINAHHAFMLANPAFIITYYILIALASMLLACFYDWVALAFVAFWGLVYVIFFNSMYYILVSTAAFFGLFTLLPIAFSLFRKHNWFAPFSILGSAVFCFYRIRYDWIYNATLQFRATDEQVAQLFLCFGAVHSLLYVISYFYTKKTAQERSPLLGTLLTLSVACFAGALYVYFAGPMRIAILAGYGLLAYIIGVRYMRTILLRLCAGGVWLIALMDMVKQPMPIKALSSYLPYLLNDATMLVCTLVGIFLCAAYVAHANKQHVSQHEINAEYLFEAIAWVLGLSWFFSPVWQKPSVLFVYQPVGLIVYATFLFVIGLLYKRIVWRVFSCIAAASSVSVISLYYRTYIYNQNLLIPHLTFGACAFAAFVCAWFAHRYKHHLSDREEYVPEVLKMVVPVSLFAWGYVTIVSYFERGRADESLYKLRDPVLTVYYMVCAITLIAVGLLKRLKNLRHLGLGLVLLALSKLFNIIWQLHDTGYRIAAFMLVGVLIILISFIYQHVSKRIDASQPVR